jgi:hypothetical protein
VINFSYIFFTYLQFEHVRATMYTTYLILDESYSSSYQVGSQPVYSTSEYRPGQTVSYTNGSQVQGTTYVGSQPTATYQTSTYQATSPQVVNGTYVSSSNVGQQKVVAEEIPVESRIEYIPFEKKYIEYDKVERINRVPYER